MEGHVSVTTFSVMIGFAFVWGLLVGAIMFRRTREAAAADAKTIDEALTLIDGAQEAIALLSHPFPPPIVRKLRDFARQTRDELSI